MGEFNGIRTYTQDTPPQPTVNQLDFLKALDALIERVGEPSHNSWQLVMSRRASVFVWLGLAQISIKTKAEKRVKRFEGKPIHRSTNRKLRLDKNG